MSQFMKGGKKEDNKPNNCHEYLGNNNYKKDNKVYTFNRDGTITITNSENFKNEQPKVSINNNINNSLNNIKNNYKTNNYQYKTSYNNLEYETKKNTSLDNYTSHPYQDRNNYDDDSDYKKDFYHKFSDPWKVRNDVENNGYTVSEFGEVFSPEQIKYYKKLGHDITPDSNFY